MITRRQFIGAASGLLISGLISPGFTRQNAEAFSKIIPSTGKKIPAIGLGTFVNFNVVHDTEVLLQRTQLLKTFFELGGGMVDSSPMYGASERNLGYCLERIKQKDGLFSATKVWTSSIDDGPGEIETSRELWKLDQFNLLQVHNLLSWEGHLETLFEMKKQGRLKYVGVTTSHGRRHRELEQIMLNQPIDFVQATYNVLDREVEQRILPVARERGIAFISNRPFQRGDLVDWAKTKPLPAFAKDIQCDNWATLLLKYIVSHPAVTCAIPATSRIDHLSENMNAMYGVMPDQKMRQEIEAYIASQL